MVKKAIVISLLCLNFNFAVAANLNQPDPIKFGVTVELGDIKQAKEWLDNGLPPGYLADKIGNGLMIGAWTNDIKMMELFYNYGVDINAENAIGEQALLHAAWKGNIEAINWLLEHGAKINRDKNKWTALHYTAFAGHEKVFDYLVSRGADINATSTNGSSVLMMAVYEGKDIIIDKLLKLGANKAIKNDWGEGALEWATKFGKINIAKKVAPTEKDFAEVMGRPKSSWGKILKSERVPAEFEKLLYEERIKKANGEDTKEINVKMAELQKKYMEEAFKKAKEESNMKSDMVLEVSAKKKSPKTQKAELIRKENEVK